MLSLLCWLPRDRLKSLLSNPAPTISPQIPSFCPTSFALAVRRNLRGRGFEGGLRSEAVSRAKGTARFQAPAPCCSGGRRGLYSASSKIMPRSRLSVNHCRVTMVMFHWVAYLYFWLCVSRATRWVMSLVRSELNLAPLRIDMLRR